MRTRNTQCSLSRARWRCVVDRRDRRCDLSNGSRARVGRAERPRLDIHFGTRQWISAQAARSAGVVHQMASANRFRNPLLSLVLLVVMGLVGGIGCGVESTVPEPGLASALRERFPDRASLVLDQEEAFVATEAGFVLERSSAQGPWQGIDVILPHKGEEAIRFRGFGGVEVRVREIGLQGEGTPAEQAVAYPRAGGTSFWTAVPGEVEEWLHIDGTSVHAGEAVAAWEVEGATVQQRGDVVDVVDEAGTVRLEVAAPTAYAADGGELSARLVGNGARIELLVDAATGEALLIDPVWSAVASMSKQRIDHTATLLGSGKVLVASGYGWNTAEVYDPATNTWSPTGPMNASRSAATATLLGNSKVLVAGGNGSGATAELYDPVTNTWSLTGPMINGRWWHTATLLGSGKVLVAGGATGGCGWLASAEIYDPATNTWSAASPMNQTRGLFAAVLLPNGKVLVAAGGSCNGAPGAELYDPATNTWSMTNPMIYSCSDHTATLLGNGKVLVAGCDQANAQLYDPATNTWSMAAPMSQGRGFHTATLLLSGHVLVTGGGGSNTSYSCRASAEVYDPVTNTWSPAPTMNHGRTEHTATLFGSGDVLVAGGGGFGCAANDMSSAELYGLGPLGSACVLASNCQSGFCADGVCCNAACNGGPCDACSIAAGAPANGTCTLLNGSVCNDGNGCTQTDTCQAGACIGGNPVVCPSPDQCHTGGVCNPGTGICSNPTKADGMACNDGNGCTQTDACQAGVCIGGNPVVCPSPDQCHTGGVCNPGTGTCSNPTKADGIACDDGNSCTQSDTCQSGACIGANSVVCPSPDQCHTGGVCNPGTGMCSIPTNKAEGTSCNDGNGCTQTDTCQAGVCIGANPVVCPPPDQCHTGGVCNSATGMCSNPTKADGVGCNDGNGCTQSDTCQSGACIGTNPVVCPPPDQCHAGGACNSATGVCSAIVKKADGTSCDDGNGCTQSDTCQSGACVGANPVICTAEDQCHVEGVCDPATGMCSNPVKPNGIKCDDGNLCNGGDTCQSGVCTGSGSIDCPVKDQCHDSGVCDPSTNTCSDPVKADGAPCNDGNECSQNDTCQAGVCTGGSAVVCTALDTCHVPGKCDPQTGVCTNVVKPDTATCDDGNPCTQTDTCQAGICIGENPVKCETLDMCHEMGTCDVVTGVCTNPLKPDGAACPDGTCNDGLCVSVGDTNGGGGALGTSGGCGCSVVGAVNFHPVWLGLVLLLIRRRRRCDASPRRSGATS